MTSNPSQPKALRETTWVLRIRWISLFAQIVVLLVASQVLRIQVSLGAASALVLTNLALNLFFSKWRQRPSAPIDSTVLAILLADIVLLTATLMFSGGPMNPVSVFYIFDVALAAVVLRGHSGWLVATTSSVAYGSLFFLTDEKQIHAIHHGSGFTEHLQGMWLSHTIVAIVMVIFISGLANSLRERERELSAAKELASRHAQLASLATLAAGAAHELGTPLGTIAIAANEMIEVNNRSTLATEVRYELQRDAQLIVDETERCRSILRRMSVDAGRDTAEVPQAITAEELFATVRNHLPAPRRAKLKAGRLDWQSARVVPLGALRRAIGNLVNNALDASTDDCASIDLRVEDDTLVVQVSNVGEPIDAEVLLRIGEPFFTTKEPGNGMGLGVLLVRTLMQDLGGEFRFEHAHGTTTATLRFREIAKQKSQHKLVFDRPRQVDVGERGGPAQFGEKEGTAL
jgi:two-component system, sensor histidine kinase RegB